MIPLLSAVLLLLQAVISAHTELVAVPVTLGLIVDRSQSMRTKPPALLAAVSALLQSSRPDDELFAVDFNDRASFALPGRRPFTNDAKELEAALTAVHPEGQTALYDGIAEGLQHLQLGHAERHALIVVSDGGDNASRRTYAEVLALARLGYVACVVTDAKAYQAIEQRRFEHARQDAAAAPDRFIVRARETEGPR